MTFRFDCRSCGQVHEGMPGFGAEAPLSYFAVPKAERERRCRLGKDDCVIDEKEYFVRGCIELRVHGESDPFIWGVWVSLSEKSYKAWNESYSLDHRSHIGPFFGWLNAWLKPYPDTTDLKTYVHLRDHGTRPYIELEPTDHPLSVEQREGITVERVSEIYALMVHAGDA